MRQLQELDQQIWEVRRRQAELPAQAAAAQAACEAQAAKVAALATQVRRVQLQQKDKEGELATKEAAIKKIQAQLYQVKTNKEYSALQHGVEGAKADQSLLEDEILQLLEQLEAAQRTLREQQAVLQQEEETLRATRVALDDEAQRLQAELVQCEAQRTERLPAIPPMTLAAYERVLVNREGLALVPINHEACGGCHMVLPPQVIHEVRMGEKLIPCDNCARILYWVEP